MKKFILPILFLISSSVFSQNVNVYLSTHIALKQNNVWGDYQNTSVLILADWEEDQIIVYSKKRQIFNILDDGKTWKDNDGNDWASMTCRDNEGINCTISLAELNSSGGQNQIYITYSDMSILYNIRPME